MGNKTLDKTLDKTLEFPRFETLKLLQSGLSISQIAKHRHVSRQAVYCILSTLNKKGLVRKIDYATYILTQKGINTLHSLVGLRYKLRQHNLHFKIKIQKSPKNWELKRNELRQLPYFNKSLRLKNNEQDLFNYGRLLVKTTTKSIIIKIPTIYATNWEHAIIQAIGILEDNIPKIEKLFKIILIKDYRASITLISQEYARIQEALAKLYRMEGNRLYLTGEDNKIWLITDFSFSTDELEFIHPEKATDDIDAIAPFLNDLRKNPTTFSNVFNIIEGQRLVMNKIIQNEIKHQKVLDNIFLAFQDWKEEFKEFKKWRKNKNV